MGIDVGGLDACILVGYPGSMMATWQRSGRVGRAGRESITALVALPDALDQYFLRPPGAVPRPPLRAADRRPGERSGLPRPPGLRRGRDAALPAATTALPRACTSRGSTTLAEPGPPAGGGRTAASSARLRRRPQRHVNLRGTGRAVRRSSTPAGTAARSARSTACGSSTSATPGRSTSTPAGSTWSRSWTARSGGCASSRRTSTTTPRR